MNSIQADDLREADWSLLQRFAAGDEGAFATLVGNYTNLVYSAAIRQVRSNDLALDVAQTVFLLLAKKAATFDSNVILSAWLIRAARFASANIMKSDARRRRLHEEAAEELSAHRIAETWERMAPMIDEGLAELSDADRSAVTLRFFEELNFSEVGEALDVSEEAAKKRVARALGKLRAWFQHHELEVSEEAMENALPLAMREAPKEMRAAIIEGSVGGPCARLAPAMHELDRALRKGQGGGMAPAAGLAGLLAALCAALVWMSADGPKQTVLKQREHLRNGDGPRFVELLNLAPIDSALSNSLVRVTQSQKRARDLLSALPDAASELSRFPFPLDEVRDEDLAAATVRRDGATATLRWARGSSLRFSRGANGTWKSDFYRPPNLTSDQLAANYARLVQSLNNLAGEIEEGSIRSVAEARLKYDLLRR